MYREQLAHFILDIIKSKNLWNRVISLDIETDTRKTGLLNNERILAVGIAYFHEEWDNYNRKNPSKDEEIVAFKAFILDGDSEESEISLLKKLDDYVKKTRPIVVIGYNIQLYDLPLLAHKLTYYKKNNNIDFWNIRNILVDSVHIDLISQMSLFFKKICREPYKIRSLEYVINHEYFKSLNLLKTKEIIPDDYKNNKVEFLYNLWKTKDEKFENYLHGDVNDVLIIANKLFSKEITKQLF